MLGLLALSHASLGQMVIRLIPSPVAEGAQSYVQSRSWAGQSVLSKTPNSAAHAWSMSTGDGRSSNCQRQQYKKSSNMRVVIVGTGGIARWIARFIHQDTGHQLLWLSRSVSESSLPKMITRY